MTEKDFDDMMIEQTKCDWILEAVIDSVTKVMLTDGKSTIIAARLEVGEDRDIEYWCPKTYRQIEVPSCFVEEGIIGL